jgi:N-glycosylase/DNA lyase
MRLLEFSRVYQLFLRIQQSSVNKQGLIQLATRIERITPIVTELAETNPNKSQAIVQDLLLSATRLTEIHNV